MAGRCHGRIGPRYEECRHVPDQRRIEQRLVALHIDHDFVVREAEPNRGFGEAIGARRVIGARHACRMAVRDDGVAHPYVVRRDNDTRCAAFARAFRDAHDHRLARDIGEGLAREARRRVTRGNEDGEWNHERHARRGRAIRTRRA